jgi:hypothetical protein
VSTGTACPLQCDQVLTTCVLCYAGADLTTEGQGFMKSHVYSAGSVLLPCVLGVLAGFLIQDAHAGNGSGVFALPEDSLATLTFWALTDTKRTLSQIQGLP